MSYYKEIKSKSIENNIDSIFNENNLDKNTQQKLKDLMIEYTEIKQENAIIRFINRLDQNKTNLFIDKNVLVNNMVLDMNFLLKLAKKIKSRDRINNYNIKYYHKNKVAMNDIRNKRYRARTKDMNNHISKEEKKHIRENVISTDELYNNVMSKLNKKIYTKSEN